MARSRCSLLAIVLAVDAFLLCRWCLNSTFVPPPATTRSPGTETAVIAAAAAAMQLPMAAQAVEKWQYVEPEGNLTPEQIQIFLWFFLFHAAGVADFYAKKTGAGPAVPINIFRNEQFYTDKPLFGLKEFQKGRFEGK
eukprot:TRINITY_DN423_c0_g1_i1.p1 TRINITY_DN423_c0_g1~~TRINITY_DN423_c0_g1_i1.p1  ORF type:complete len:162 (+),score=42.49 TRINITY_DN423_c0_g1_i1:73-486(+)